MEEKLINFPEKLDVTASIIDNKIKELLKPIGNGRLNEAMLYSCLSGGKRLRAFLALASCEIYGIKDDNAVMLATVIEIIHTYSLIHDDLPAMDDDKIRRGKLTCHVKFDEATAILAGDALLTSAFEILAKSKLKSKIIVDLIKCISKSIGANGMAGGQMLDLLFENTTPEETNILIMHSMKTGKLFSAASQVGAIITGKSINTINRLSKFGLILGISYQIIDDLLDVVGEENIAGKKLRKDYKTGKASYAVHFGVQAARVKANELIVTALEELEANEKIPSIISLISYIINRQC